MKKILLLITALTVTGFTGKLLAQCDIKDVVITIPTTIPVGFPGAGGANPVQAGTSCNSYFNVSFKFNNNSGNKTVVIQAWKGDTQLRPPTDPNYNGDYPNYWNCSLAGTSGINKAPELTGQNAGLRRTATPYSAGTPGPLPFLNIAFDAATNTVIGSASYPGGGVTLGSGYTVLVGADLGGADAGYKLVTLTNLFVSIPNYNCGSGVNIAADVWSSQASLNSGWTPHCVICNQNFAYNYPLVNADILCVSPRRYVTVINNVNTFQTVSVTWKAYVDNIPLGGSRGIEDLLVDDQNVPVVVAPGVTYSSPQRNYTGNNTSADGNKSLWVEVTTTINGVLLDNVTRALALQSAGCIGLPVNFQTFTATRNGSSVLVKWETGSEQNNTGFAVERNINGSWQQVAFVPTLATGGNSDGKLSYSFVDMNSSKGITQYRIKQIDIDTKSKYSEVRSVRGDGQTGKTIIYPNPTNDGKVNIVFEDAGTVTRNISVLDMSGRIIRQINNISNNNLQIEKLTPGMYSLRVVIVETGQQNMEKIIVNK